MLVFFSSKEGDLLDWMFLDILSSLSLVVMTNLHPKRKTQEKVLSKEQDFFVWLGFFFLAFHYAHLYLRKKILSLRHTYKALLNAEYSYAH